MISIWSTVANFFGNILSLGTKGINDHFEIVITRICNFLAFFAFSITAFFTTLHLFTGNYTGFIVSGITCILYGILLWLAKQRQLRMIRVSLAINSVFGLCIMSLARGPSSGGFFFFQICFNFFVILLVYEPIWVNTIITLSLFTVFMFVEFNFLNLFPGVIVASDLHIFIFNFFAKIFSFVMVILTTYLMIYLIKYATREKNKDNQNIAQKDQDIRTMLSHLKQGIVILQHEGRIHSEYSKELENIVERENLAGLTIFEVLNSGLDPEQAQIIESIINSCIGEIPLNFDLNRHLLPKSMILTFANKEKHIEMDWVPISSNHMEITAILLSLKDITQILKIKKEQAASDRKEKILQEIIGSNASRFKEIFADLNDQIIRSMVILRSKENLEKQDIISIRRYIHTLKGQSRFACWNTMARKTNEIELELDSIGFSNKTENQNFKYKDVVRLISETESELQYYQKIYDENLGKLKSDSDRVRMISDSIEQVEKLGIKACLKDAHQIVNTIYTQYFYASLSEILQNQVVEVASIARELKKPEPKIEFMDNNVYFDKDLAQVLRRIFSHCFNNCIDHGIETEQERQNLGKDPAGKVIVKTEKLDNEVVVKIRDDGRGLHLQKLRKKGMDANIIDENSTTEDIANIIFISGISTKDSLEQVSGHGIGMDAIQTFLKEIQAKAQIILLENEKNSDFCKFQLQFHFPLSYTNQLEQLSS